MREWSVHSWDYRRVLERLHAEYGATPFFKITVESNPHSPLSNSIRISPSGLGLPDRNFYYADPNNKVNHHIIVVHDSSEPLLKVIYFLQIINAYKRLLKDIVMLLRATSSEAIKFSNDIFYYEKRIAEITPESTLLQDPIYTYNPISVSELKITAASVSVFLLDHDDECVLCLLILTLSSSSFLCEKFLCQCFRMQVSQMKRKY